MLGAPSAIKTDEEGLQKMREYRTLVESHAVTTYPIFEPVQYTTQVVSGTNYQVKVKVGEDKYIHFKVNDPTPMSNNLDLMEFKEPCTLDETLHFGQ
jgi:hypothetical protein